MTQDVPGSDRKGPDGWPERESILIASLREDHMPSPPDLKRLARRIYHEVYGRGECSPDASARHRRAIRIARGALGSGTPS
jgi:hypothetical protein